MNIEGKIRILILDDNISDAELMKRELAKGGLDFTAETVCDRETFVTALAEFVPDLILADYSLPSFDGMSALRLARKSFNDIPVIIVSGAVGEETAIEAVKAGATDYVLKQRLKRLGVVVCRAIQEARQQLEKRRVEEALKQNEKYFRLLVERAPEPIIIQVQKRFAYVNSAAIKLFGAHSKDQLIGRPVMERIHPDSCSAVEKRIRRISENKEAVPSMEEKYLRLDNSVVEVEASAVPYEYKGQNGALVFVRDITKHKQTEDTLRRDKDVFEKLVQERTMDLIQTQMELERAKRLSDIGALAATVAHELRNPLAAINMAAANIKRKANNPELSGNLANIEKKVFESDQIINNLLFYSRLRPPHFENINLLSVIKEDIHDFEEKKHKSVIKKIDPIKDLIVEADPFQIKEVITNVLNNAFDALLGKEGEIKISAELGGRFIKISVSDDGKGMYENDLKRVFDPFFSTKTKGTGLGLTVCKQIMEMHKGSISIESELGKGTTVTVYLPIKK